MSLSVKSFSVGVASRSENRTFRQAASLSLLIYSLTIIGASTAYGRSDVSPSEPIPATLEVSYSNRQANEVTVSSSSFNTLIDISSEFGRGNAAIKLKDGEWPESLTIRLHLRGLEGFVVSNGITTIEKHQLDVQAYDQNMSPFSQEYLMSEAGYYEIRLPRSLFAEGVTDIQIQWVDFYR